MQLEAKPASVKEIATNRRQSVVINLVKSRKLSERFTDELDLDPDVLEKLIKKNIKQTYISQKPKKQQLYFLFKLILNRRSF